MTSSILITGGTGTLGRHVTQRLRSSGAPLRVLSRHQHPSADGVEYVAVDLLKGDGLGPAVAGIDTIVHLAGSNKGDDVATANLVAAAIRADVRHLVYISVIAADRMPIGYFRQKLEAERIIERSGLAWTTLRAAQFHELLLFVLDKVVKLPFVPAPRGVRLQPVDARDVAARLAELTLGEPAGLVPDIAGPEVLAVPDLVRSYLRARGKRRALLPVRLPGRLRRLYLDGANLTLNGAQLGTRTWTDFLAQREPTTGRTR
jgi:uncharacterized protein YbjT (DUF2867 family)